MSEFFQASPARTNRFHRDEALRDVLELTLAEAWPDAEVHLEEMGRLASEVLPELQERAEANPPRLAPYDAWGRRVDRIEVDPAWSTLVKAGQEAGLVALAYEPRWGAKGRVLQAGILNLFMGVSATADCPLAMTDAAARVLLNEHPSMAEKFVPRLTARRDALTCGQWMTEREGGSDVSRTSTVALRDERGRWTLTGTKWFTSATTADIALALARPEGEPEGSSGLSLFLIELRDAEGNWNGIQVRRLKDKLGTRALPTAELELKDTVAEAVGGMGSGVRKIAPMLNITRFHAAVGANGLAGYGLSLAADYARKREAFGRKLQDLPLHRFSMAEVAAEYRAGLALCFRTAELLGESEAKDATGGLARLAAPLTKMAVARSSVDLCSRLIESFGGAGYVEDTGIPRILRDVHVQSIWEGTTSVMALDVRRALSKGELGSELLEEVTRWSSGIARIDQLASATDAIDAATRWLKEAMQQIQEDNALSVGWTLARTYMAALMCRQVEWELAHGRTGAWATGLQLFTSTSLVQPLPPGDSESLAALAFGEAGEAPYA